MTPQVGVDIYPCGACGSYFWMYKEEVCPHFPLPTPAVPRKKGDTLKYDYPPELDARGRYLFRQRINAKRKRDRARLV